MKTKFLRYILNKIKITVIYQIDDVDVFYLGDIFYGDIKANAVSYTNVKQITLRIGD